MRAVGPEAADIIERLKLKSHPEGGRYVETYRERPAATCIVAPAFEFSGFEMATSGWELGS